MKQIIINITKNDEGEPNLIVNCLNEDGTKFIKVKSVDNLATKDTQFVLDLEQLLENYKD